ncbi:hypothetical protein HYT23_06970 [Candidatus Pacearchaeota archaeon]|nr:hypothetical protein [Candidatus Pacearchaeota archaeon]
MTTITQRIKESIVELIEEYKIQKTQKLKNKSNVHLGRNISMGSQFQYIFAKKLFANSSYKVLVDYPIRYDGKYKSGKKGKKNLYPDILILNKNGVLKALIELKIDLGFLRGNYRKDLKRVISAFEKNGEMKYNQFVGFSNSEEVYIKIPKNFIKIFIIGTKINHTDRVEPFKKNVKALGFKPLILLDKVHPNPLPDVTNFRMEMINLKKQANNEIDSKREDINRVFKGLF